MSPSVEVSDCRASSSLGVSAKEWPDFNLNGNTAFQMEDEMLTNSGKEEQADILVRNKLQKYYHGIPSVSSQAPLQP